MATGRPPFAAPVVEHHLSLGNTPYGSMIRRVTAGAGSVWVDLLGDPYACLVDLGGSEVRYLAIGGSSLAPIDPDSAWVVGADGTLRRIDADGTIVTVAPADEVGRGPVATPDPVDPEPAEVARPVRSLAPAPDGGAWLATTASDAVVHVDREGMLAVHRDGFRTGDAPGWVAAAPDGGAWVAVPDGAAVVRVAPDGAGRRIELGGVVVELVVTDGSDGAWIGDVEHGTVAHLGADGTVDQPVATGPIADLALGPDGAPWFVTGNGQLGRLWDGRLETFALPALGRADGAFFHPVSIAAADDASLVFTEYFYGGEGSTAYLGRVRFDGGPALGPGSIADGSATGGCAPPFSSGPVPFPGQPDDSTTTTDGSPEPPPTIDRAELTTTSGPP